MRNEFLIILDIKKTFIQYKMQEHYQEWFNFSPYFLNINVKVNKKTYIAESKLQV